MNSVNHETQLDLRLTGSKEFGLLLKLIFYNSFEVIPRFPPFNQRNRFKTQFHAIVSLVEKTSQTANKKGRAERKLLHVKMSSGIDSVRRTHAPASHSASLDQNFSHGWVTIFSYPRCSAWGSATNSTSIMRTPLYYGPLSSAEVSFVFPRGSGPRKVGRRETKARGGHWEGGRKGERPLPYFVRFCGRICGSVDMAETDD